MTGLKFSITGLFYAVLVVSAGIWFCITQLHVFALNQFPDRIVSYATSLNISVEARLFFACATIIGMFCVIGIFLFISKQLRFLFEESEWLVIEAMSVCAIVLECVALWLGKSLVVAAVPVVIALQLCLFIVVVLRNRRLLKNLKPLEILYNSAAPAVMLSVFVMSASSFLSLHLKLLLVLLPLVIIAHFILSLFVEVQLQKKSLARFRLFWETLNTTITLSPVWLFVGLELYTMLVFRLDVSASLLLVLIFTQLVGFCMVALCFQYLNQIRPWLKNGGLYLLLLISILTLDKYQVVLTIKSDFFEPANPGLAIQQWWDFGKIPLLQTFNAHMFSDSFYGFVFVFVHGFLPAGNWQYYDFLQDIIELVIAFTILGQFIHNRRIVITLLFGLPILQVLFPPLVTTALLFYLCMGWLLRVPLKQLSSSALYMKGLLFGLLIIGAILWNIDHGLAAIVGGIFALVVDCFLLTKPSRQTLWSLCIFFGGALTMGVFVFLLSLLLLWWQKILPQVFFIDLLHILRSGQTFGGPYLAVGSVPFLLSAFYYIIAPFLLIALFINIFFTEQKKIWNRSELLLFAFLFFYSFFFLTRTLVRHSLVEFSPYPSVVFFALIILLYAWKYFSPVPEWKRAIFSMSALSVLLLFGLKASAIVREPIASIIHDLGSRPRLWIHDVRTLQTAQDRSVIPEDVRTAQFSGLEVFVHENLTPEQTFFDFSTSPMLHYVLHRENPIYANHHMLMHDDYLQQRTLEQLSQRDIPFVVYQYHTNPVHLDTIPFFYRYPVVAEYIHNNYHPYMIANNREIWIRNDWKPGWKPEVYQPLVTNGAIQMTTAINPGQVFAVGSIPLLWGMNDSFILNQNWEDGKRSLPIVKSNTKTSTISLTEADLSQDAGQATYLLLHATAKKGSDDIVVGANAKTILAQLEMPANESAIELIHADNSRLILNFTAVPWNAEIQPGDNLTYAFRISAFPASEFNPMSAANIESPYIEIKGVDIIFEPYQ